jgi:proline iminopeptidase
MRAYDDIISRVGRMYRALTFAAIALAISQFSISATHAVSNGDSQMTQWSKDDEKRGVIEVEGARLDYLMEGSGPTCLLIGSSIMYPRLFSRDLRKHVRIVFLDGRHFVPTENGFDVHTVTIDTYAADIEKARKTLKLGKVFIMGHSIHGDLAMEYARRYPQNVIGAIVIASPPAGLAKTSAASQEFWDKDASGPRKHQLEVNWEREGGQEAVKKLPGGQAFIRTYVTNGPKYWFDQAYDCSWIWAGMDPNTAMTSQLFSLFQNYDLTPGPGKITAPIFLALGRYDYVVPHTLWDDQKQKLPNLSFHLFEQSGHTPQLEESALFDKALLAWMATIH